MGKSNIALLRLDQFCAPASGRRHMVVFHRCVVTDGGADGEEP
jgi:hypothetical protein